MKRIFTLDFTQSFIDELAAYIERAYMSRGRPLEKLAVVFGGKRPAYFLRRELARRTGKAFIPPRFYTVDALMSEMADMTGVRRCAPAINDAFEIYRLAQAMAPDLLQGRESFAKFLPWALDILDFIGQLDIEAVDQQALQGVRESARIGYPVPDSINRLLEKVGQLRQGFHERLRVLKGSSRGLEYRRAMDNVDIWMAGPGAAHEEIIFANFFYFHKTQEAVVRRLYKAGKATLIFQGDQDRWPVLERMAHSFGHEIKEGPSPVMPSFDLKAYAVSDGHVQAATVRDILQSIPDKGRALVVVPDTAALLPLLMALPEDIADINVSMGYPLRHSSLYLLLQAVLGAQSSRREGEYDTRSYLALIGHPLARSLSLGNDARIMPALAWQLERCCKGRVAGSLAGRMFIGLEEVEAQQGLFGLVSEALCIQGADVTPGQVKDVLAAAHEILLRRWEGLGNLGGLARELLAFLDVMAVKSSMPQYPLNGNIVSRLREWCLALGEASFAGEPFSVDEMSRILEDSVGAEAVHFQGTPLKGLQILGLEETRSLNFDHVIVMDVNEGVLPRISARASLIPREVMIQLKLDRLELEEELQRYQFMRVISSARKVHLVYQHNREKEPSRFVQELVWQAQRRAGELVPYPAQRGCFTAGAQAVSRSAAKTPAIMMFLEGFTYSASAINAYMANPYAFYMTYVLGLREEEDLLDEPDAAVVGNFFHRLLEGVYRPLEGCAPDFGDDFMKRLWRMFDKEFDEVFSGKMRSGAFLVRRVMEHKLRAFLASERLRASSIRQFVAFEKDFPALFQLPSGRRVRFRAKVDRIEESRDDGLLVLDYKTGGADRLPQRPLVLAESMTRREIFEKVRSFQLPLYMGAVAQALGRTRVNAGLYSLRNADVGMIFNDRFPQQDAGGYLKPFYEALDFLIGEIMDPQQPFVDDDFRKTDF